ncbi:glycoside hydrolase family 71 protein [Clavulina sp. PMI_390]|nr:glycoside hydrolase family 71 protein [Clavulina sp. PMI_390]
MRLLSSVANLLAVGLRLSTANAFAVPPGDDFNLEERAFANERLVFCHFMIGIVADRTSASDYDADMRRAKSMGIDAFALNIGTDTYTDQQLGFAYQSAAKNGMKVFISFDFNWYNPVTNASAVGAKIAQYASQPAQLRIGSSVFASSFSGDGVNVTTIRENAGVPLFWAPNFHPGQGDFTQVQAALNWMAWPNNGYNKAPDASGNISVIAGDESYITALNGKPLVAPASGWFSTHYGAEVPYSKNWVFPGDLLWYNRWVEILQEQPQYVEIITWNDYGESHYVGPLSSPHNDDGNSKWVNDMPHNGWLDMAKPFIAAWKVGSCSPIITSDQIVYWYRVAPSTVNCDATDTTMKPADNSSGNYFEGRPSGWQTMQDAVFVVPLLTHAGTIVVKSGGNEYIYHAPAGASAFQVPMGFGSQHFELQRNGATVMSATSLREILDACPCGLYNFNAYVGTVPEGPRDVLGPDSLTQLTNGLNVSCAATPSLASTPPATTTATFTSTIGGGTSAYPLSGKSLVTAHNPRLVGT